MADRAELIRRLRKWADMIAMGEKIEWGSDSAIMREAADALEAAPAVPDAVRAIQFAVKIDDHYDRLNFLNGWIEGDTSEWPEFAAAQADYDKCILSALEAAQDGVPLPAEKADHRSHSSLLYNGLIAITWSGWVSADCGYVLTPAGRRALEDQG